MKEQSRKVRLIEVAGVVRSKNAGPYELTFDIIFNSDADFAAVVGGGSFTREMVARLYGVPLEKVYAIIPYPPAKAIKITMERPRPSGNLGETDVYGAQQHGPLLNLEVVLSS